MKTLKKLKWNLIILALIYVAIGVVLLIAPGTTMTTISYLLAIVLLAVGVVFLINYLRKDVAGMIYRYDLVVGLSAILGGILVIIKVDDLIRLIPVALGFIVTISGILKMQNSVDMLRLGKGTWYVAFAMAIINIVIGILLLLEPFAAEMMIMCIGIAMIYSGLTDLYVTVAISHKLANMSAEVVVHKSDEEEK